MTTPSLADWLGWSQLRTGPDATCSPPERRAWRAQLDAGHRSPALDPPTPRAAAPGGTDPPPTRQHRGGSTGTVRTGGGSAEPLDRTLLPRRRRGEHARGAGGDGLGPDRVKVGPYPRDPCRSAVRWPLRQLWTSPRPLCPPSPRCPGSGPMCRNTAPSRTRARGHAITYAGPLQAPVLVFASARGRARCARPAGFLNRTASAQYGR